MGASRMPTGGRIDRSAKLNCTFDGTRLQAYAGDSLASALLAPGQAITARGFKYHRPRGVFTAGPEEPNAMVTVHAGSRHDVNVPAPLLEAYDGLAAQGQNAWPGVRFDVGAINNLVSPVLSAGFYYKTFIGPFRGTKFWMMCEAFIRRAAGMGRAVTALDPERYDKGNLFCEALVVGSGASGLTAALTLGRAGVDTILVEQDPLLGGQLLSAGIESAQERWRKEVIAEIQSCANVRIMSRTVAFGAYENGFFGLLERVSDHQPGGTDSSVRQRYMRVRSQNTILACGALERPLVFGNNDLPGVMLAGSMRCYLNRYAVRVGERVVLATNNDTTYATAIDLARAGAKVTLADARPNIPTALAEAARAVGVTIRENTSVLKALGRRHLRGVVLTKLDAKGAATKTTEKVTCDSLGTSGGWSPALHLWSQRFGKPVYDEELACFVPASASQSEIHCVGKMMGQQTTQERHGSAISAARDIANVCRDVDPQAPMDDVARPPETDGWARDLRPLWAITDAKGKAAGKAFVDFQHDVKLSDIDQAHLEGYVSVEHLKRYTTLGMATDQGKTSNINALARMAHLQGSAIAKTGTTVFRPPYLPISLGAIVGPETGQHFRPTRLSTLHDIHVAAGAKMTEAGAWMRPRYYTANGKDVSTAYPKEAAHVRANVGMVDVSTLGKIAVQGPDAAEFLNRIYVNGWLTLKPGQLRYGIMLREDGIVLDDGATACLAPGDYFMTTTTANAAKVLSKAEFLLQTAWRDLRVHVTSLTDQFAAVAVAGPQARAVLSSAAPDADLSAEALPLNRLTYGTIGNVPVRIHRMSYSGELAYEVFIPSGQATDVWQALLEHGAPYHIAPYGTEAMGALRIEKGHFAGPELDGRTTLGDMGMDGFASRKKPFVGSVLRQRPHLTDPARPTLVGLEIEGATSAAAGSLVFARGKPAAGREDGWVSSTTYAPALDKHIALAFIAHGIERMGEMVQVVDFTSGQTLRGQVCSKHFFDAEGVRQNA